MAVYLHLTLTLLSGLSVSSYSYTNIEGLPKTVYKLEGDINIGGIFPLHQSGYNGSFCGALRELGVLQRAEAMAFYIKQINEDDTILPNITLGFTILDDCYKETTALAQGLQFIPHERVEDANGTDIYDRRKDVVAVIGAESSTNSKQLAELLGLFAIPQISYLSTSPELGDAVSYPYFSRIVPSDKYQISAMVDLLEHYKWTYVSFVYSFSFYGLHAYLLMLDRIRTGGSSICLAAEYGLPQNPVKEDYVKAVQNLVKGSDGVPSHTVILFLSQTSAMGILKAADEMNLRGNFTWIASDAWGRNVQDFHGVEEIAEGTLTVKISSVNDAAFDNHFSKLNAERTDNTFLEEFWSATCNKSGTPCDKRTTFKDLKDIYKPENTVGLVKVAIYFLANSLNELFGQCRHDVGKGEVCTSKQFRKFITGAELQHMLFSMKGCVDGTCVNVAMGEGNTQYSIMNLRKQGRGYDLRKIGYYDTTSQSLHISPSREKVIWNSKIDASLIENGIPISVCSKNCRMGQRQAHMSYANPKCCWVCKDCKANEYTNVTEVGGLPTYQCQTCGSLTSSALHVFTSPMASADQCQPIVPQSIDLADSFAIVILVLDCICFVATVVLLVIYFRNKAHRLIKATSLELSYIIWSGLLFSYVSIFFYFVPLQSGCHSTTHCDPVPNMHWCYLQFLTFNLSFTIINAPMLTRVNRIYRIFTKGRKSATKPRFIENRYQFMIVGVLVLVQVIIITICCLVSKFAMKDGAIRITNYQDEDDFTKSYISCELPYTLLLPPVIYNFALGIACAYHAFRTRKLPDNFNESKFIGMTVYTTVIMWIAFIPAYISINSRYYKGVPLSVALLINAVITTGCLFVPRLYALRWVEGGRMNLRTLSVSLHSLSDKARRASVPDAVFDHRQRSVSSDSGSEVMSTPDVISGVFCKRKKNTGGSSTATSYLSTSGNSMVNQELSSSSGTEVEIDLTST